MTFNYQPLRLGWRVWFYRDYFDGPLWSLHLGPLVIENR